MTSSQKVILASWLIAIGLIGGTGQSDNASPFPPAYRFFGAAVVYSFLFAVALLPGNVGRLAAVFAIAWTLGLAWKLTGQGISVPHGLHPPKPPVRHNQSKPTSAKGATA